MASNVLVVMSDQHNPKIQGLAGSGPVRTPNLDALAGAGTRFSAAYCPSPICVPSRASFATGLWTHQIGFWDNAMGYDGSTEGWAHLLQAAGRRVESIGKLHYRNADDPTGFDRQHLPMHLKDGIGQVWGSVRDPLPVRENAKVMVTASGKGESDYTRYDAAVTERACRWLEDAGRQADPWVLYVGLVAPHFPYIAPERFFDLYDPDALSEARLRPESGHPRHPWVERYGQIFPGLDDDTTEEDRRRCTAAYYGLVSYLDDNVGKILDALDRAGLSDDTLVVYSSDHGDMVGTRGLWGKSLLYEESAGIPMIAAGPGVPQGHESPTPVNLVDLHPTILDAADVSHSPDDRPGRSLVTVANTDDPDRLGFSEYHAMGAPSAAYMVRRGSMKLNHYVGYEPELFDLSTDPHEANDLAADPTWATTRRELTDALCSMLDPEAVDRQARRAQAALVERFGGPAVAAAMGTPGATPAPMTDTDPQGATT